MNTELSVKLDADVLLMDILNELQRCPKELYEHLSVEDKAKFISRDDIKNPAGGHTTAILKRDQNLFPSLALRYIECMQVFKRLRFGSDAAGYEFIGINKKNITLRDIGEARLSNDPAKQIPASEPDYILSSNELTGVLLYDHLAGEYNYPNSEKIIIEFGNKTKNFLNAIVRKEIQPINRKKIINKYSVANITRLINDEKFNREYETRKGWLVEQLKIYDLKPHHIPAKICKYLMGVESIPIEERAVGKASNLLEETQQLFNHEQSRNQEEKNPAAVNFHLKECIRFLIKDILFMQPALKNENGIPVPESKANACEFQLLVSGLSLFKREKDNLPEVFRICKLTGSKNPHPYLHLINVNECTDALSFYKAYLFARKKFLKNIINRKEFSGYHFLLSEDQIKDETYFIDLANRIAEKPVNLPRGLFKDAVVTLLRNDGNETMRKLLKDRHVKHSIVFIIHELYKQHNDAYQPFYNLKRNYRIVDEWNHENNIANRKPLIKLYKTVRELTAFADKIKKSGSYGVYCKCVIINEKVIRHYRAADQMLFLMANALINRKDEDAKKLLSGFFLKDILALNEKSILGKKKIFI